MILPDRHQPPVTSLFLGFALLFCSATCADVRMPGFYGDHMVLQQQMPLRIQGWADPDEQVTVSLAGVSASAQAAADGRWTATLPAMQADGGQHTLSIKGKNSIDFDDVLIGEVWLCSGQSNMEWSVDRSTNAKEEIAASDYPLIRHVKFEKRPSPVPLDDISAEWQVCSPDTAAPFTAVGFFMARHLHKELGVPIGLINSSWGGTRIEPWVPPAGFQHVPALRRLHREIVGKTPGAATYQSKVQQHINATQEWLAVANAALADGSIVPANPTFPGALAPFGGRRDPTALYNGMIHAIVGFPIRGAIWYQGESNQTEGMLYYEKMKALIGGWRELWQQGDFPFYYVQIAPFQYGDQDSEILAELWEAQAAALEVPNTGMVVINDVATLKDIHPPNKQDVGRRLALLALKHDYGHDDVVANSPEFDSLVQQDGRLKLSYRHTGGGLKTRDGNAPSHFEIIGPGSDDFVEATATIEGDTVILSSPDVAEPTAFRFAWHQLAEPNLMGGTGLPVGAVRGGKVPGSFRRQ